MKANTLGLMSSCRYHSIAKPRPLGEPISSAAMIAAQAPAKASRKPTITVGNAAGTMTLRSRAPRPTPIVRAALTSLGSTLRTPAMVLSRSGKNATYTMMNTGRTSPMPKMNSASGIQAMPEIGRRSSTIGSRYAFAFSLSPMKKPSGTASSTATIRLITRRVALIIRCSTSSPPSARLKSAAATRPGVGI